MAGQHDVLQTALSTHALAHTLSINQPKFVAGPAQLDACSPCAGQELLRVAVSPMRETQDTLQVERRTRPARPDSPTS
eukprot:6281721-Alexandrium_andersonii.AAC.1